MGRPAAFAFGLAAIATGVGIGAVVHNPEIVGLGERDPVAAAPGTTLAPADLTPSTILVIPEATAPPVVAPTPVETAPPVTEAPAPPPPAASAPQPSMVVIRDSLGGAINYKGQEEAAIEATGIDVSVYDGQGGRMIVQAKCEDDGVCNYWENVDGISVDGIRALQSHAGALATADGVAVFLGTNGFVSDATEKAVRAGRLIYELSTGEDRSTDAHIPAPFDNKPAVVIFSELFGAGDPDMGVDVGELTYVNPDEMNPAIQAAVNQLNTEGIPAVMIPARAFAEEHEVLGDGDQVHLDGAEKGLIMAQEYARQLHPVVMAQHTANYPAAA